MKQPAHIRNTTHKKKARRQAGRTQTNTRHTEHIGTMMPEGDRGQATTAVRQALNASKLIEWMVRESQILNLLKATNVDALVPSFKALLENGMQIRQFGFGQSNPTYLISIKSNNKNDSVIKMVLRKKPQKVAHASAHALHREFRVLKALQHHNRLHPTRKVPVPKAISYCRDKNVLGAEFYLMEYVEGRIFTDPSLPGMTPQQRAKAYQNVLITLANLHMVNPSEVGLESYGRAGNYVKRQLARLLAVSHKQSQLSGSQPVPEIEAIAKQLQEAALQCPDQVSLLHGDFKVDNLVFHPTNPQVIAVLDWELSTIGDPLCDLANLSMMYLMPGIEKGLGVAGIAGKDLTNTGIPSRQALAQRYCELNSRISQKQAIEWGGFYLAFLFFKNSVIIQGVAQRAKTGVASSAMANRVATLLPVVISMTQKILKETPPPASAIPTTTAANKSRL